MASFLYQLAIDARDPAALARFWAAALDQPVVYEADGYVIVSADEHSYPGLCFVPVPEDKAGKNRLHIDLNPDDRDAEVDRLIGLGARMSHAGQPPEATWVVLADPEGNEFCVLRPHASLTD
ncbi:MAG TPA: VOC family protein [Streptosporangiaceae bacterium]|jgi:predicted enzyme related to lactoylglutathione lyase